MFLNNHSYYSLRFGTLSVKQMLEQAKLYSHKSFVLTDINNTSACLSFVDEANKVGIKPIIGIDFRNGAEQQFIGIAKNNNGFRELNEFLSEHLLSAESISPRAPLFNDSWVVYPWNGQGVEGLRENEYIGITSSQIAKLKFSDLSKHLDKLVVLNSFTFRNKRDFNIHRLLRAVDNNTLLSKLNKSEQADESSVLTSSEDVKAKFSEFDIIIKNTEFIINNSSIDFEFGHDVRPKNKKAFTESVDEDLILLRTLIKEGVKYRFGEYNDVLRARIETELSVIRAKEFVSYFLINWDIVSYARSQNYFYVGRGSGANSLIAYLLRITDVDPIDLDLYFERFINLYRENPPDFDLDFSWKDRNDITRYIFEKHGEEYVALLATYTTFQVRSTIRELAKVFGLPNEEIEELTKKAPRNYYGKVEGESSRIPNVGSSDHLVELVLKYANFIEGFPNYLGIHSGGILISQEKISSYSAVNMPPKGYRTVQFDMVVAEDIGLYKFDILSQRGLGHIKDAVNIVKENVPAADTIDIHNIAKLKNDEKLKEQLRSAKTLGCFYIESPAMRMLLSKLQVDNYLGLVAASSIIRPGVAKSGMMREYILRYRFPERRKGVNPIMKDIMPETYGVMVYQEDVIKVSHYFAGLSLAEADVLRRGMSGKYRSKKEFQRVKDRFFSSCQQKGHPFQLANEIWFQIESFAGYSFSKGHSASYAVESYQSLFLKTYFPREFMVAVINNFGGFYRTETYVHELRMAGAKIEAPCVNNSKKETSIKGDIVHLGFVHLKNLESKVLKDLIGERNDNGKFTSLSNFVNRVSVSKEQLQLLVQIGAFRFTGKPKKKLFWEIHLLINSTKSEIQQNELFSRPEVKFVLPELYHSHFEDAFDEIELLGFPLSNPFDLLKEEMKGGILAKDLKSNVHKYVVIYAYLVHVKYTSAKGNQRMYFATFLDYEGVFVDTVHFPNVAARYPFRARGIYRIEGKVVEEFDFISIEVSKMEFQAIVPDPRYSD
ncbi:MAG: DNA polymerase III subunit alpha [Flavobacteriales bacterium]|nr:DNA polymerase III subunit alpha [Flavobacteriales bacterium]